MPLLDCRGVFLGVRGQRPETRGAELAALAVYFTTKSTKTHERVLNHEFH